MRHGFVKVAAGTPNIRVGDCVYNAARIQEIMDHAVKRGVCVLLLPELCLTGYTCSDLFLHDALLDAAERALSSLLEHSKGKEMLIALGIPLRYEGKLYNCAAILYNGRILGVVPKTHLPNYGEFYELRQFTPAPRRQSELFLCGERVPFGTRQLFRCSTLRELCVGIEICEDLWVPNPPSNALANEGATVILNLSASDETIGKDAYRRLLLQSQSARLCCAYLYADAGHGESTTDLVFAGHNLIAENGTILKETEPFAEDTAYIETEIDCKRLMHERRRMTTFSLEPPEGHVPYLVTEFSLPMVETHLTREISSTPFIPQDFKDRNERCEDILRIQAHGLKKRIQHTNCKTVVIGISGGLDSTLALLVAVRAMELTKRPASDILAVTMPCFGTTGRTRTNAEKLCDCLGIPCRTVDITAAVKQHFQDIGHPEDVFDVTFENGQARERTQVLMDIANQSGGMVVGTGDLSELALGWATYNGDHMSMYGVNASVPKSLIRHIIRYLADTAKVPALKDVLMDILDTPVSPELLPADGGEITQQTEELVGPYVLHDFFLYHMIRWGAQPQKVLRMAAYAFFGTYSEETIRHWLTVFCKRFFSQQFKRSCMPDGPKVGSVTLSPRGDWRMPSDAMSTAWLDGLRNS